MISVIKKTISLVLLSGILFSVQAQVKTPVYLDDTKPINERVEDALSRMTLQEKIGMLHAQSRFSSAGVPRLGIPEIWMSDGPHGVRAECLWDDWAQAKWTDDSCTAFPALTCLAASWNKDIALLYGKSIGEEARYRNKNVLLGPGVNIYRSPLNGRNFEYMGEDPYLSSKMVVPYVKGVQQNGVAACVKHFALNNQEDWRSGINVNVDDRALHEIYLPAFKAAVQDGQVWAIMGAYNKYKNFYCCQNPYLLKNILRDEWGFKGVVISDWGGVHDTKEAVTNGLDMEFGTWTDGLTTASRNAYDNYYLSLPYLELIQKGEFGTKELDEKVRHILRLSFLTTMNRNKPFGSIGTPEHSLAAREIGEEGIVLLKNENNVLPVDLSKTKKIAVIGENAFRMMTVGGGSSSLKVKYEITPLEGLKKRIGSKAEIVYARGYNSGSKDNYDGVVTGQNLTETRSFAALVTEACSVAKDADYVIFVGGLNKNEHQDCEGADRLNMDLPYKQDSLITELAKVNKNLVVVNISGNAVSMPWVNKVPAIVQAWYLGSEAGNALAAVLVGPANGGINPSGKLPFTFPKKLEDNSAHSIGEFPGNKEQVNYKEGIYVGYRWFDKQNIQPLFDFGHGLSYTTFEYSDIKLSSSTFSGKITVTVKVKNTGKTDGKEIAQLYLSAPQTEIEKPVQELKGFAKTKLLRPNETEQLTFVLDAKSLASYRSNISAWVADKGKYEVRIGSSSRDIRLKAFFNVPEKIIVEKTKL